MSSRRARARHSARAVVLSAILCGACVPPRTAAVSPVPAADATRPSSLRDAFRGAFLVGAAVNEAQFSGRDARGAALVAAQYNTISPENALKWEEVHPRPGVYEFAAADRYVAFGERHGMTVIGHTLVWHSQTPKWVFEDGAGRPASRDTLLARMRDHIQHVVGRYKGRVKGWDVVNEALDEDGSMRKSPWRTIIGDDFVEKAFEFAREADPGVELYYNDYSVENAPKRAGAVALVSRLKARGLRIDAVGLQDHDKMDWPFVAQVDSTIAAFAALGVGVNITELDVDVLPAANRGGAEVSDRTALRAELDPYKGGLPDSVQQALARRYGELFGVYLRHRGTVRRVTFWGVGDGDSWLNDWPVRGRTSYPLLFDRADRPKPAFDAVIKAARDAAPSM